VFQKKHLPSQKKVVTPEKVDASPEIKLVPRKKTKEFIDRF
jgi:hypothetical protein